MKRILLVEDQNPFISENLLKAYGGLEFTICKRGDEAIDAFSAEEFDGVILDLRLPVLDGFTVLQAIRKIDPDIPVVVLSAYGDKTIRERVARLGGSTFFNKPPDYRKLHKRLMELIARAQQRKYQTVQMDTHQIQRLAQVRRLNFLKEQKAAMGLNTPPHVLMEIEDLERELYGH